MWWQSLVIMPSGKLQKNVFSGCYIFLEDRQRWTGMMRLIITHHKLANATKLPWFTFEK